MLHTTDCGPQQFRPLPAWAAEAVVFVAAAAVLVLEIVGLRLVAPYVGLSLQTSTAVIGTALAAIAFGAWTGGRLADGRDASGLLAVALLLGGLLAMVTLPLVRTVGQALAGGPQAGIVLLLALVAVFPPAALLSAVTPMVATVALTDLGRTGAVVGRLSGIGTLGAITSTFLTGFVLVPALPTSVILLGTGGLLVLTGLGLGWHRYGARRGLRLGLAGPRGRALALAVPLVPLLTAVAPTPCERETAYHCVRVEADPARPTGRVLWMDTLRHSYVDLADPRYLEFSYIKAMASVLDAAPPAGRPVEAVFVGGGGLTLPRYLAATRPGSLSTVLEIDPGVIEVDRDRLAADDIPDLRIRVGDGRTGLAGMPDRSAAVVVGDAFGGLSVPWHLATREAFEEVDRVLADGGVYLMNVIDYPPDLLARAELATLRQVFGHVVLLASPATLALGPNGGGNHVLVASRSPLPLDRIADRLAELEPGWVLADEAATARFAGSARPLTDDFAPADQLLGR